MPIPVRKHDGETDKRCLFMTVWKIAIAFVSLNVTAKYCPCGLQDNDCGRPPTSVRSTIILLRSATGRACFGREEAAKKRKLVQNFLKTKKKPHL